MCYQESYCFCNWVPSLRVTLGNRIIPADRQDHWGIYLPLPIHHWLRAQSKVFYLLCIWLQCGSIAKKRP